MPVSPPPLAVAAAAAPCYRALVEPDEPSSAERFAARLSRAAVAPAAFRAALAAQPFTERDGWLDRVLGLGEIPDDGPALPRGGVPYLPCAVDVLLAMVDAAAIGPGDVFVDIGAGVGRAAALVHLVTGAAAVGIEIQPALVDAARALGRRLAGARLTWVEGDAPGCVDAMRDGTVFFVYCPFSDARLDRTLGVLEGIACQRPIRVCCVDLPLLTRPWLTAMASPSDALVVYRGDGRARAR